MDFPKKAITLILCLKSLVLVYREAEKYYPFKPRVKRISLLFHKKEAQRLVLWPAKGNLTSPVSGTIRSRAYTFIREVLLQVLRDGLLEDRSPF